MVMKQAIQPPSSVVKISFIFSSFSSSAKPSGRLVPITTGVGFGGARPENISSVSAGLPIVSILCT